MSHGVNGDTIRAQEASGGGILFPTELVVLDRDGSHNVWQEHLCGA